MILLIYESYRSPVEKLSDKIRKLYPESGTVYVERDRTEDALKILSSMPLVKDQWLVFVNMKEPPDHLIIALNKPTNVVVFLFKVKDDMLVMGNRLSVLGIDYKHVDDTKVEDEDLQEYVMNSLDVDLELAKYICARHKYYIPKVMQTVDFCKLSGIKTKSGIKKYTQRSGDVSYQTVFDFVLGVPSRKKKKFSKEGSRDTKLKDVYELVRRYRHGHKRLLEFLNKRFAYYLMVYEAVLNGKLSFENVKEYYEKHREEYTEFPEYMVVRAIESMNSVSYDYLYMLSLLYQKEAKKTSLGSFLLLLQMSE